MSGAAAKAPAFPAFTGYVVDAAHVLPPATVADLTAKLGAYERSSGNQVVVATIPSLGDVPIEDYGYQLGRAWGVGQKGKNNGAILIVAPADKKLRIEVGYGLEPVLTDALTNVIINQTIVPAFRQGDIGGGVTAGVDAILAQLQAAPGTTAAAAAPTTIVREAPRRHSVGPGALFWLAIVVVWLFSSIFRGRGGGGFGGRPSGIGSAILWGAAASMMNRRGGGFGGGGDGGGFGGGFSGGDGGGFGGGGGGSFGGGGSSGSW